MDHLRTFGPDALILSCSLAARLPTAHAAITMCRGAGVPVVAGGRGFGPGGRYARVLNADAWAPTATRLAKELALRGAPSRRQAGPRPLRHLEDQEYTLLTRDRTRLVTEVFGGLRAAYPPMASYTPPNSGTPRRT
ncbi:hypothetical protein NKH77_54395 [Streptomyces sp. M19]